MEACPFFRALRVFRGSFIFRFQNREKREREKRERWGDFLISAD
jgi:hypothetical protein